MCAAMSAAATDAREQHEQREQRQTPLQSGLDLIDQGFTVFDAELRLVAWTSRPTPIQDNAFKLLGLSPNCSQ